MRDEITHRAPGPVFIMYEWRPGWGNHRARERPQHSSTADRGAEEVSGRVGPRAPARSRSLVQARFMCTEGSQAGVPALSLAPLQTRLPRRSAGATAKQSREEGNT